MDVDLAYPGPLTAVNKTTKNREDRRLETGDWRLETGDWRLETGDRRQEAGGRRQAQNREDQKTENSEQ